MTINKTQESGIITLALAGRLDASTAPQLQDCLVPAFDEADEVILEFSKLTYVSSAGLRVLLVGLKTATAKNAEFVLTGVSEEIMEILDMTGFSDMLTIK